FRGHVRAAEREDRPAARPALGRRPSTTASGPPPRIRHTRPDAPRTPPVLRRRARRERTAPPVRADRRDLWPHKLLRRPAAKRWGLAGSVRHVVLGRDD